MKKPSFYNKYIFIPISGLIIISFIIGNPAFSSFIYSVLIIFYSINLYRFKKVRLFSLQSLFFIFFISYTLIPIFNYLIFGQAILFGVSVLQFRDPDRIYFLEFINLSMVITTIYILFSKSQIVSLKRNESIQNNIKISISISTLMILSSFALYFAFVYYNFGFNFIFTSRGYVYEEILSLSLVKYGFYIGLYFYIDNYKKNKFRDLVIIFAYSIYSIFLLLVGFRGQFLVLIIIALSAYYKCRTIKINYKLILIVLVGFLVLIMSTVYRSIPDKSLLSIFEWIRKNPLYLNLGSIEYSASYMNFTIARSNDINYDFYLQGYFVDLKNAFLTYVMPSLQEKHPILIYRDTFFYDRFLDSGNYGGTGYSLVLDSILNLGKLFFWIPFVILPYYLNFIDKERFKNNLLFTVYFILLIPFIIQIGRSGLPIGSFLTKLFHSIIIYSLFVILLNRKL